MSVVWWKFFSSITFFLNLRINEKVSGSGLNSVKIIMNPPISPPSAFSITVFMHVSSLSSSSSLLSLFLTVCCCCCCCRCPFCCPPIGEQAFGDQSAQSSPSRSPSRMRAGKLLYTTGCTYHMYSAQTSPPCFPASMLAQSTPKFLKISV